MSLFAGWMGILKVILLWSERDLVLSESGQWTVHEYSCLFGCGKRPRHLMADQSIPEGSPCWSPMGKRVGRPLFRIVKPLDSIAS